MLFLQKQSLVFGFYSISQKDEYKRKKVRVVKI